LTGRCWRTRAYGDFWSHVLVAEGAVDIAVEASLGVQQMAALSPIVVEAGGRLSDLDGTDGPFGTSAVTSNGQLHDGILSLLKDGLSSSADGAPQPIARTRSEHRDRPRGPGLSSQQIQHTRSSGGSGGVALALPAAL